MSKMCVSGLNWSGYPLIVMTTRAHAVLIIVMTTRAPAVLKRNKLTASAIVTMFEVSIQVHWLLKLFK